MYRTKWENDVMYDSAFFFSANKEENWTRISFPGGEGNVDETAL